MVSIPEVFAAILTVVFVNSMVYHHNVSLQMALVCETLATLYTLEWKHFLMFFFLLPDLACSQYLQYKCKQLMIIKLFTSVQMASVSTYWLLWIKSTCSCHGFFVVHCQSMKFSWNPNVSTGNFQESSACSCCSYH